MSDVRSEPGPAASPDESDDIDRDEVFHMLRNRRRRYALHYLKRADGPVELGALAEQVAAWENEIEVEAVDSSQRKRVYNALQQTHLPELADNGVVEYDRREGRIALTDRVDRLDIYLEVVPGRDIPWSEYYLALGALSTALVVATGVNAYPFSLVPDVAWALLATSAFTVSAVVHLYVQRSQKLDTAERPPEMES